jgi:hypothetical protein
VRFYKTINRELTAVNLQFDPVIENFTEQWKALLQRKKDDPPEVPKISKALPIMKWTEAFDDFLNRAIGTRTIPLSYVTRETVTPTNILPPQAQDRPHSIENGSVEGDMIAFASHDHPSYRDDNAQIYYYLEEATRGTPYAATLKPFQRRKDGRTALLSIRSQYAGRDKWDAEIKRQDDLIHTRKWKGQNNFSLEKFIAQHRNAFVSMQQCAEHVSFQLPNELTRVGYLLDAIETSDAGLQAAMAQITTDDGPNGKRNNFEAAASYLLPYDPVAKKRAGKRDQEAIIGDTNATVGATFGDKPGIGKSGVHLWFYKPDEYKQLTGEQKLELKEWRAKTGGDKKKTGNTQHGAKTPKKEKSISSTVAKEVAKQLKKVQESDIDGLIASLNSDAEAVNEQNPSKKARFEPTRTTTVSTAALKTILRRAKNNNDNIHKNESE